MMSVQSVQTRSASVVIVLLALLSLPARLAHELVHAVFAAPFADRLALVFEPTGLDASLGVEWHDGTPGYAMWLAAYAPMLLGLAIGIWGAVRLVSGVSPREPVSLLKWGVLAFWWSYFTIPSAGDRNKGGHNNA